MTILESTANWLARQHDLIEIAVWVVGLLALFFAGAQLSESRKQRGISESFSLSEKINSHMSAWQEIADKKPLDVAKFERALAEVLTTFEIVGDGINRGYLSHMSREILTQQIIGNLNNIYIHPASSEAHKYLCHDPSICSAFKIFILNNYKLMRKQDASFLAFDVIFSPADRSLLNSGIISFLERRLRIIRLRISATF